MDRRRRPSPLTIAAREVARHPWRTVLVAQGLVWAIAIVVAPAAVIEGSKREALLRAREIGTDLVQIGPSTDPNVGAESAPRESDLESFAAALDGREFTAFRLAPARFERLPGNSWLLGVDDSVASLRNLTVLAGELPAFEGSRSAREEVPVALEWTLATQLFEVDEPIAPDQREAWARRVVDARIELDVVPGAEVPLRFHPPGATPVEPRGNTRVLRVAAVVSDSVQSEADIFGTSGEKSMAQLAKEVMELFGVASNPAPWLREGRGIYVPRKLVPGARLDWIMVRSHPLEVPDASESAERALVDRDRTILIYTNAVLPVLSNPELSGYLQIHRVLSWVFLSVGGLVLANILLLAGNQRRREIALRRTEGALAFDIYRQFLWEGAAISIVGLVLGVIAGIVIAWLRVWIDPNVAISWVVPWGEVGRSAGGLVLAAIVSTLLPAWRACQLDPVILMRGSG